MGYSISLSSIITMALFKFECAPYTSAAQRMRDCNSSKEASSTTQRFTRPASSPK